MNMKRIYPTILQRSDVPDHSVEDEDAIISCYKNELLSFVEAEMELNWLGT